MALGNSLSLNEPMCIFSSPANDADDTHDDNPDDG